MKTSSSLIIASFICMLAAPLLQAERPNIILIMADDIGTGWLPFHADRTCMPFLDSVARQGVIFDNCFATASLCAPSRAGLLTGTFQQEWGAYWNKDVDDHGIPADRVVMAEPLRAAGYATAMIGKWHVARKDPAVMDKVWTEVMGESLPIPPGHKGRWKELSTLLKGSGYQSSSLPGQHPLDRGFDYYYGFNSHNSKYIP